MRVTTKSVDEYTVQANIALERAELDGYIQRIKEELAKSVTVEGFRKGKAPQHLADSKLGEAAVREEALELALSESFAQASGEQGWDIARTTDLKIEHNDDDRLEYSILVHVWPAVVLPELASVHTPRKVVQVTEADIDEALDTVLNMRATFLDKTGPASTGDRVEVDFDASQAGVPIQGGSSRNHPLVIGGKAFMPGFEEQIVGLVAGASHEFSLTAPEDYYERALAGKQVDFKVTLRRVQTVLKPSASDEFAKSLGQFDDMGQLRTSLRQGLANEKGAKEQQRLRLAILDAVIAQASVPAPEAMVAVELEDMVHRFSHDLQQQGIELPMYLARLGKTQEQLEADWRTEAQRQVRIMLILRQAAKDKALTVDAGELDTALKETITELIRSGQATQEQVDPERVRSMLAERILREKVLRYLEDTCGK